MKYIVIHGHFYQPPRENPWTEVIDHQESAHPYHDWNERVNAECYAPNTAARVLGREGRIIRILNNYRWISFNFGPTLISWLEKYSPGVYGSIVEAETFSARRHGGHGNAIAQPYNHMIMPLANRRDKATQIKWGKRDFKKRFGRRPEGMWLPETAVDMETLQIMADEGIKFTVLAPHQAGRVRKKSGDGRWEDIDNGSIDSTRPYLVRFSPGSKIAVFFYNGKISHDIAFGDLLNNGATLTARLTDVPVDDGSGLIHIATDGETYGHHHKFGDMALAYAVELMENNPGVVLSNYGEFLSKHPPEYEVEILENTSWSCIHGIERWRSDCGCTTNSEPGWNQAWRTPLRNALDWLRDQLIEIYEDHSEGLLKDPWSARDDYFDVILERKNKAVFIKKHALSPLSGEKQIKLFTLLEIQRNAMLMYTSCGWFFADISRIETVQILKYAARAIDLAGSISDRDIETPFIEILSEARSNMKELGTGADIYRNLVLPSKVDAIKIAATFAVSSLDYDRSSVRKRIGCFLIKGSEQMRLDNGEDLLTSGKMEVRTDITGEKERISYIAFCSGKTDYLSRVWKDGKLDASALKKEMDALITKPFNEGDIQKVIRGLKELKVGQLFTLGEILKDRQEEIIARWSRRWSDEINEMIRGFLEKNRRCIDLMEELHFTLPQNLRAAIEIYLPGLLLSEIGSDMPKEERITGVLSEMKRWGVTFEKKEVEIAVRRRLEESMNVLIENPGIKAVKRFTRMLTIFRRIPVGVNLWTVQNSYFEMVRSHYPHISELSEKADPDAMAWVEEIRRLGELLNFGFEEIIAGNEQ
ncbi:alpha-amylase 1 [bacterium BMS3Bbin06]|nr:alpha-amylase 1 [bacterium BMS3Bbin06]